MNISYFEVDNILKTLPIGYYIGRNVNVELDKNSEGSYYEPMHDKIVISFSMIEDVIKQLNNVNTDAIKEKIKSQEFTQIISNFSKVIPSHQVNTRFKLYYGSAGCGKTTLAMKEADNNCMVCHSAMLPSDLMEDFKFVDGKADFQPSALQIAMTEGKPIVLDEINLLPFESLRFMQSILDGKSEFVYKGKMIKIKEGFQVIGTMNLTVNGCTYALPEPLVDRCFQAKKFKLTANDLMSAII